MFLDQLCHFLDTLENTQNLDYTWTPEELTIVEKIVNIYNSRKNYHQTNEIDTQTEDLALRSKDEVHSKLPHQFDIDNLLKRPQIPQRSSEWYEIMKHTLSASEITHVQSQSARKRLIISKLFSGNSYRDSVIESSHMSAVDWGVRFEPVVKQIYSDKYSLSLKELGKIFDTTDPKFCASPDGLVCESPLKGTRLIEIKCPVSRENQNNIPKQYYNQMQMQMHITGVNLCDYIEARFHSSYSKHIEVPDVCLYSGFVYIVYNQQEYKSRYEYSPLNASEWIPTLEEHDSIIEKIPWKLYDWKEVIVNYDNQWWNNIKPYTELFWNEYQQAKENPESFKKQNNKPAKKGTCLIQLSPLSV